MAARRTSRRPVGRKPKVQGAPRVASDATAQQAVIRPAETADLDRDIHLSHDQEYPSDESVHGSDDAWSPSSLLPHVPPRPGYVQRWIRAAHRDGRDDVKNLQARFREGWQPRRPDTVRGFAAPTMNHGHLGSCIQVEGMVLCEMRVERNEQRAAYYKRQLDRQTQAIDEQLLKIQQPGHPIDRLAKTRVTVGKRPVVQEDDAA